MFGEGVNAHETVIVACADEGQAVTIGRESERADNASRIEQQFRLPAMARRSGIDLALLEEQDARAIRRSDGRMTCAELDGRVAAEVDEENFVLDTCSNLRGVRRRLVGILGIATQHVQQRGAIRDEGQLADIQAIVGAEVRQGRGLERARAGSSLREPHVAPTPSVAHPGQGTPVRRSDNVGRERSAEDLLEVKSWEIGRRRGEGQQQDGGRGKESGWGHT